MAISKSAAIAGALGTGGGAVGTVAVVKYAASNSKQETTPEENSSQSTPEKVVDGEVDAGQESSNTNKQLEEARKQVTDWPNGKGKCVIKIKESDGSDWKGVSEITSKDDLTKILEFLNKKNGEAEAKCKAAGEGKDLKIKKVSEESNWAFETT